jgi:acyl-CoA synthetase (AMP-forming)/AMP-acid ligase II
VSVLAALLSGASVIAYPSFVPQTILAHARRGQAAPAGLPAAVPFARDMGAGGRPGAGEGIAAGGEGNAARGVGRVGDAGLGNSARHRCGGDAAAGSEGEQTRSQGGHARSEGAHVLFATDWGSSAPTPPSLAPAAQPSRAWYSAVPTMHLLLLEVAEAEAARAQRSLHGSPLGPPAALPLPRGAASDPLLPSTLEGASVALAAFDATHRHAPCTEGNPGAHLDSSADSHFPASPLAPPTPLYANPAPQAPPPSSPPCPCGLLFIRNCSAALLPSISSRLEAMLGCQVLTTYAMTESMPIAANRRGGGRKLRSVGMSTGPEIRVVRPTQAAAEGEVGDGLAGEGEGAERVGVECAVGEEGEVCVRGGCVTSGYETRPHMQSDPNLSSFYTRLTPAPSQPRLKCSPAECARTPGTGRTPHVSHRLALPSMCSAMRPPSHPPNGGLVGSAAPLANGRWLRTGDRGMVGPDGHLYLSGRFKEIINRAGARALC